MDETAGNGRKRPRNGKIHGGSQFLAWATMDMFR